MIHIKRFQSNATLFAFVYGSDKLDINVSEFIFVCGGQAGNCRSRKFSTEE